MQANERGSRGAVGVLGGGALGLTAALRLAQAGRRVTLIEREPQLGGLAAGFRVGPSDLEKFYHHIFGTDTVVIGLMREMGLEDRLVWQSGKTSVLYDGRIAPLNSPMDFLRFPFVPFLDRLRWVAAMAFLKAAPNERVFAGQRAADWTRRAMGQRVYEVVWEPLLRGKFGQRKDEIAMSWFWSRVHERTFKLGYPRGGFQQLYEALGTRIRDLGGTVLTNTTATLLRSEGSQVVVKTEGDTFHFDQVLVTLPTRLFARLAEGLPAEFVERYPGPDHYGAHVVVLGLDRPLLEEVYWLNVNQTGFPFLALVEHTNFMPAADYGGKHLVYLGNYLPMDHPLFGREDADVVSEYMAAIGRIRPEFRSEWVTDSWVFKAPYAQPIVTGDYVSKLPPHETPLPGVFLANMAHVYPQDRGQNYSMRLGERLAALMLA